MTDTSTVARVPSGIEELDRRGGGGLPAGGLYVVSSTPGHARTATVLQFVAAGLGEGERVGLITRSRPDRLFREADDYGLSLEEAWRDGGLTVVGFRGEYEMRLRRAGSPEEVFRELASLMEPMPSRLALDPGSPLWEGRGDGATAHAFVDFLERTGATCLATTTTALERGLSSATELVTQAATGLFELEETPGGLVRLRILKLEPGGRSREDLTLSLAGGRGLTAAAGAPSRRRSDVPEGAARRALLLPLEAPLPEELEIWLSDRYDVDRVGAPLDLIARLQEDRAYGFLIVHLERERLETGLRACRVCRRLRPELSVVVLSSDALRAGDRARLLRAGADECLTGRVNVRELASRLELVGSRAGPHPGPEVMAGEETEEEEEEALAEASADGDGSERRAPLDAEAFTTEVSSLLEAHGSRIFTVVRFHGDREEELLAELTRIVRAEEGDLVGPFDGECAVLLPDTRPVEAEGFMERALEELARATGASPEVEILGGVRDGTTLRAMLA